MLPPRNEPVTLQHVQKLMDVDLLGLAVRQRGRLVTFDARIPLNAAVGAKPKHFKTITDVQA